MPMSTDNTSAMLAAVLDSAVLPSVIAVQPPPVTMVVSNVIVEDQLAMQLAVASRNMRVPGDLIERAAVTVPIAPVGVVNDTTVFEAPGGGGALVALANYSLVLEQLRFERSTSGWSLTVGLNAAAPAGTTAMTDAPRVALRYNLAGTGAQNELALTEITRDGPSVQARVTSTDLAEQDRVFQALTESSWAATLVVARTVTYATPVEVAVDGGDDPILVDRFEKMKWFDHPLLADREVPRVVRPGGGGRVLIPLVAIPVEETTKFGGSIQSFRRIDDDPGNDFPGPDREPPEPVDPPPPPPPPTMETRYRVVTSTFEQAVAPLPFVFPVATNPAMYVGIAGASSGGITMIAHTLDGHLYLQESEGSPTFYFVPDELRLARGAFAPHAPLMTLSYGESEGASDAVIDPEAVVATLDFDVVPYVSGERLTKARSGLATMVPGPYKTGATEPVLAPLRPRNDRMHLTIELAHDAASSALTAPVLDLVKGFRCRVELPAKKFRPIYEAMFAATTALFHGAVEVTLTDVQAVTVPFSGRMADAFCPTSLLDVSDVAEDSSGRLTATVRNTLESRVHLDQLRLVARHNDESVVATLLEPAGPLTLTSSSTVPVVMSVPAASAVTTVGFVAGGLSIELDPAALYDTVLDRTTSVAWSRLVDVNVARALFDGVDVLQVDLEGAEAISMPRPDTGTTPYVPPVKVTVHEPMKSVIVGTELSTDVRYRLRRILSDGTKERWTDWVTDDTGGASLYVSSLPPTTASS
jgi:hypothetical protein